MTKKSFQPETPTHRLKLKARDGTSQTEVGIGYENKKGYISIQLGPGVVITSETMKDNMLTLFPSKETK